MQAEAEDQSDSREWCVWQSVCACAQVKVGVGECAYVEGISAERFVDGMKS